MTEALATTQSEHPELGDDVVEGSERELEVATFSNRVRVSLGGSSGRAGEGSKSELKPSSENF